MEEKNNFTCQNTSCKRTFTTPLKTLNLKENPTETYYACPFCLTKIEQEKLITQDHLVDNVKEKSQTIKTQEKPEMAKESETPSACKYHLGYLSERGQKDTIPDECILCKNIVDCMLKRMRE